MRRAARRDENEAAIVEALRKVGAFVGRINEAGLPDLLVGHCGKTYLIEVKSPLGPQGGASKNGQKLKPLQVAFHAGWRGEPVHVVRSVADALGLIGAQPLNGEGFSNLGATNV